MLLSPPHLLPRARVEASLNVIDVTLFQTHSYEVREDIISTVGCANNDLQGQEMKGQNDEGVSSFISALKNTSNLWPEDDPPHRCHPWEPCRNLKCRVKAEIENQEYAAAGECDDCGENVNDCECGS